MMQMNADFLQRLQSLPSQAKSSRRRATSQMLPAVSNCRASVRSAQSAFSFSSLCCEQPLMATVKICGSLSWFRLDQVRGM